MEILFWVPIFFLVIVVPLFLGFAHGLRPQWFSGREMLYWFIGTVVFALSCIYGLSEITDQGTLAIDEIRNYSSLYFFWILTPLFLYFLHSRYPQWFSGGKMFLWLITPVILSLLYQAIDRGFLSFWIVVPYLFWVIIPLLLSFTVKQYPQWFSGWKILFWFIGLAVLSLGVDIAKLVPYYEQINQYTIMMLVSNYSLYFFMIIIPLFLCFAHMQYPKWFSWSKILLLIVLIMLFALGYLKTIAFVAELFEVKYFIAERTRIFGALLFSLGTLPIILIYGATLLIQRRASRT